ncbi:MAG: hypothetical protein DCC75_07965 [Proteobacteria bacterium]|nr:MAG: hypothetical protein DCC75_07965 [Pseudomonadota bacterium]
MAPSPTNKTGQVKEPSAVGLPLHDSPSGPLIFPKIDPVEAKKLCEELFNLEILDPLVGEMRKVLARGWPELEDIGLKFREGGCQFTPSKNGSQRWLALTSEGFRLMFTEPEEAGCESNIPLIISEEKLPITPDLAREACFGIQDVKQELIPAGVRVLSSLREKYNLGIDKFGDQPMGEEELIARLKKLARNMELQAPLRVKAWEFFREFLDPPRADSVRVLLQRFHISNDDAAPKFTCIGEPLTFKRNPPEYICLAVTSRGPMLARTNDPSNLSSSQALESVNLEPLKFRYIAALIQGGLKGQKLREEMIKALEDTLQIAQKSSKNERLCSQIAERLSKLKKT